MPFRSGIDGQQGSQWMVELKSAPRRPRSVSSLWHHPRWPSRTRWFHLIPLACLVTVGAAIPGYLLTLVVLLCLLFVALGAFLFLVQLPVGYLVHRWRDLCDGTDARRRSHRSAPSQGL